MVCRLFSYINFRLKPIILCCTTSIFAPTAYAFDAGEHAIIGNKAFLQVAPNRKNLITNLEMKDVSYNYGQLMAMSGDMYRSVEEIALSDAVIMSGYLKRNRESLKKCVDLEIEAIRNKPEYNGCDDMRLASKKIRYLTLAHDNYDHFAWHNIKKYVEMHNMALWFAQIAHLKCDDIKRKAEPKSCSKHNQAVKALVAKSDYKKKLSSKYRKMPKLFPRKKFSQRYFTHLTKQQMIDLALFANAAADHYLSDAFSAGHLRVPRSQIDRFVASHQKKTHKVNQREEGSSVSGALTQFLHHNDGSKTGIKVRNSLGETFVIRSDKQLFAKPNSKMMSGKVEQNNQLQQPANAIAKSLAEVFAVIENGQSALPQGEFAGLEHVPFAVKDINPSLNDNIKALVEKQGGTTNAFRNNMSENMQLVTKAYLKVEGIDYKQYFAQFVATIPTLMAQLRDQIEQESQQPEIQKRVPKPLLTALKQID